MAHIKTDLCIIGAGSGGLSLAAGAVQMGARVVLVEAGRMGGDCLNYGCVPSKALLAAGKQAQTMRAGGLGIAGHEPDIDYAAAMDHVGAAIATIEPHDSQDRFEGLGVHVIRAFGRFLSGKTLQAGEDVIEARRFVIATGSSPFVPPIAGLSDVPYLTNETLWELRDRPDHLIIIGGGPIGMEMAQAHRRLGSKVTMIEGAKALGKEDPELAAVVLDKLRHEGIEIVEGQSVTRVGTSGAGVEVEAGGTVIHGTHLLVAVGRAPNVGGLDLEKAGVDFSAKGIKVGADLRTTNRRIYAIGDVTGGMQFTHVAGYHAGVVIRSILMGLPAKASSHHIPWATYTDPELAQVGMTEAQARDSYGDRLSVARFDIAGNDRAIATGKASGLIKVMVVKGRPVGASIVGDGAGDLIGIWAMAIANKMKMSAIAATVLPYPTMGEVNKRAAGAYFSPKLFDNPWVKRAVRAVQAIVP